MRWREHYSTALVFAGPRLGPTRSRGACAMSAHVRLRLGVPTNESRRKRVAYCVEIEVESEKRSARHSGELTRDTDEGYMFAVLEAKK
jgi:hypothetical protein